MDLRRHCLLRQRGDDCDGDMPSLERTGSTDGSEGMNRQRGSAEGAFIGLLLVLMCVGAWLTHIVDCLVHGLYVLLLVGVFVFPIGIFHGIGVWFGFWA
jgi:hypothetical protein